jgi:hypothetical protein
MFIPQSHIKIVGLNDFLICSKDVFKYVSSSISGMELIGSNFVLRISTNNIIIGRNTWFKMGMVNHQRVRFLVYFYYPMVTSFLLDRRR